MTRNLKKGLCYPSLNVLVKIIVGGKKSQISVQKDFGDHIVLIRQTDDICFRFNIKHYL